MLLEPGPVRSVCGHCYPEGESSLGLCWCGMGAVAGCTVCSTGLCGDHVGRYHGRVVCAADRSKLEAEAEELARPALDLYAQQAARDEQEYERLTPGFPYIPAPPGKVMTYADRRGKGNEWLLRQHDGGPLVSDIVRVLNALVPDRQVQAVVKPRIGWSSVSQKATGWVCSSRSSIQPGGDSQIDSSATHDVMWRWLILPANGFWETSTHVAKGSPLPPAEDMRYAQHRLWPRINWNAAVALRGQLLEWLGHPNRP